jgi:hypothetical protein
VIEIHKHTDWLNANRYTVEERERICRELLGEAQYWNIHLYIKHMHDSTKRPWVGLTDEEIDYLYVEHRGDGGPTAICEQFAKAYETYLKEKNNG